MHGFKKAKTYISGHPLKSTPRIEDERLEVLVQRLRDGTITKDERDEIASGHVKLAIGIACCYKGDPDVLIAEALFGVARGIDHAQQSLVDNNLTPYLVRWIHKYCALSSGYRGIVGPGIDAVRKHLAAGSPLVLPEIVYDVTEIIAPEDEADQLLELILECASDDLAKTVIQHRIEGMTDVEIARLLGLSFGYVAKIKRRVYEDFQKVRNGNEVR